MKKIYGSAQEALDGLLFDGMFIAAGGFGLCGIPELLLQSIKRQAQKIWFSPLIMQVSMILESEFYFRRGRSKK